MLEFDRVTITAGSFRVRADFSLETGRFCAVIGPSGAGKSTLLNAVAGFAEVTTGRILWQGRRIDTLAPGDRPLAILFQDGNVFPHLTLAQNVGLGLRPDLRLSADQHDQVAAALERVGLAGMASRRPGSLSGGQLARSALARVLVQHRDLILLDEPFSALGPALKQDMLDMVADLAGDIAATVLMVTHDPGDARRVADQTVVVIDGQAGAPGPTGTLLDNPPPALQAYLTAKS
ncbi:MAG: thiamine ABC transporter ATP-binding protein [Marinibacterium sp.]